MTETDILSPHAQKSECKRIDVAKEVCYIKFNPLKHLDGKKLDEVMEVKRVILIAAETVRGETLALDVNAGGEIVGIELIAPGMKPCQPSWQHNERTH